MRNLAIPLALLVIPVGGAVAAEAVLPGPVTYEVSNRGALVLRWQVNPDGTGEIWRADEAKDQGRLRKYRLRLEGRALETFVTNIEDVREMTSGGIPCDKELLGLPAASVVWDYPGAKQTYGFDAGCRSDDADEAAEILGIASSNVETLARIDADPYATEPVR